MTMDNGEGRPLDEEEAGPEDPQGWYFDLPGGAWERQEEKNRSLRQRVLGNIEEDAEKSKGDPFAKKFEVRPQEPTFELRKVEPEAKKRGGLFGFGKKGKGEDGNVPHGTEALEAGALFEDDSDDEWTTEPPLKLSPFPRSERDEAAPAWGESDGGWDLTRPAETTPAEVDSAGTHAASSADEDFVSGLRAWAREAEAEEATAFAPEAADPWDQSRTDLVAEAAPEPSWLTATSHFDSSEEAAPEWLEDRIPEAVGEVAPQAESPAAFEAPAATYQALPGYDAPAVDEVLATHDAPVAYEASSFEAPSEFAAEVTSEGGDEESEAIPPSAPDLLRLRPRAQRPEDSKLDWNFGPAAWSDRSEADEKPAADAEMSFDSMRKWAERSKDSDHPHFTKAHDLADADEADPPAPIPLRPRHHEEERPASGFAPDPDAVTPADETPRSLPIQLRSRTEPTPEPPRRAPEDGPSKWDDFFSIEPGSADSTGEDEEAPSEGIASMRAWAQKRAEPEAPRDIPEEFLKPFDWELQEDGSTDTDTAEIPASFLEPFDWEKEDTASTVLSADAAAQGDAATPVARFEPEPEIEAQATADEPEAVRAFEEFRAFAAAQPSDEPAEDDDPLAGLFERASSTLAVPEKKKGRGFGRLFGRKKDDKPEPVVAESGEPGDWLLPGDDEPDLRTAAIATPWDDDDVTAGAGVDTPALDTGWGAARNFAVEAEAAAIDTFAAGADDAPDALGGEQTAEFRIPAFENASVASNDRWATWKPGESLLDASDENSWSPEPTASALADAGSLTDDGWSPEPVETPAWDPEPVAEAVASVEEVAEPAAEKAWWASAAEEPSTDTERVVEAVASLEDVPEPTAEKAWWGAASEEPSTDDAEPVAEAVASLEEVAEPATEKAWWEAASEEPSTDAEPECV